MEIRHVEGSGGDRGLDLFVGQLKDRPTVWQCKHFPNGLGPKQRPQVTESLRTATKHYKPAHWVLVISTDLDAKAHQWFQKLQRSYTARTAVGIMQASDIVRELIHRRNIRDTFFPGAVLDTVTVNRSLKGLSAPNAEDLARFSQDRMDELVARLEEVDARFNYQIVFGPNIGAEIATATPNHPLLVASVLEEGKRIDVFARDLQAIRLDPPTVTFLAKPAGVTKINEFFRSGRPQVLEGDEFSHLKSTFDFLLPDRDISGWTLMMLPHRQISSRLLPLRLAFTAGQRTLRYDCVQFRVVRLGREEAEIESTGPLPFVLSLVLTASTRADCGFGFQPRYENASVRGVAKAIEALSMMREGCDLEIYALEIQAVVGIAKLKAQAPKSAGRFERVVLDAARVCHVYKVDLRLPRRIQKDDLGAISFLLALADGIPLAVDGFDAKLVKSKEHEANIKSVTTGIQQVMLASEHLEPKPVVFGAPVDTGPVTVYGTGTLRDGPEFLKRYTQAAYGEAVPFGFSVSELRAQLGVTGHPGLYVRPV